jgi:UDP-N-acetylglucosamine acyltransferase
VLPFFTTDGNPPRLRGLNSVGLRRAGFSENTRRALKDAYRTLLRPGLLENALEDLEKIDDENIAHLIAFIRGSKRGFTK